jgi:hypothetical protein
MVDLIPNEYRVRVRVHRALRNFAVACGCALALVALGRAGLAYELNKESSAVAKFKQQASFNAGERARLGELQGRKDGVERQVRVLEMLRGGAAISDLFFAVEDAGTDRVWFQELSFAREAEAADAKSDARIPGQPSLNAINPPAAAPAAANGAAAWRSRERAEIRGQALDHSALAEFVNRLGGKPGIAEVRLLDTSTRTVANSQVVEFRLIALLGAAPKAKK